MRCSIYFYGLKPFVMVKQCRRF